VATEIFHHALSNGMVLLAERMEHVRSAALNFLVPAGCIYDPEAHLGTATVLADMITRGAGNRDSRKLSLDLDNIGLDRDESVGLYHTRFWGATLARHLPEALKLYADILRCPRLPAEEIEPVKALAFQDLQGLEDEPRQKVLIELRQRHFPMPLGRDRRGTVPGIESLTPDLVRQHYQRYFQSQGTILSVAGNIEWPPLRDLVVELFAGWEPRPTKDVQPRAADSRHTHIEKETTQTQIGIAYQSVPIAHPDYYAAQAAVNVLSGGMSARLFTEVREKRGLCYAVYASYLTLKGLGSVLCYAGTTNERAQETLDVTLGELQRLENGIEAEEVERVRAGLKSALIMQEESTSARAGSLASDWYYLGRVRSFDEIQRAIDGLTPEAIVTHLKQHPPRDFTIVTLGPAPLRVPA
jgi:predicted Zn-dependent peptidase